MTTRLRLLASATATVVAAAMLAPSAAASSSSSTCKEVGGGKMCQRPGHSALHAKPTPRNPNGTLFSSPWLPGYGRGHLPPMIALD